MNNDLATVTNASPLRVLLDGSTVDAPAKVLARADSWAPAAGDRVVTWLVRGTLYVVGLA
jgi:hypothetical protein